MFRIITCILYIIFRISTRIPNDGSGADITGDNLTVCHGFDELMKFSREMRNHQEQHNIIITMTILIMPNPINIEILLQRECLKKEHSQSALL